MIGLAANLGTAEPVESPRVHGLVSTGSASDTSDYPSVRWYALSAISSTLPSQGE